MSSAARPATGDILALEDVHVYYGAIHALKGVSLHVGTGEIVTLIGANGAGKSTTLRAINGLNRPRQGSIHPTRSSRAASRRAPRVGGCSLA